MTPNSQKTPTVVCGADLNYFRRRPLAMTEPNFRYQNCSSYHSIANGLFVKFLRGLTGAVNAIRRGGRGLTIKSSINKLLEKHRGN